MPPAREDRHQLITAKASTLTDDGLVIGLDFAHGELDGEAAFIFGKVWAQRYRRLAGIPSNELEALIKLDHDRHLLSGGKNEEVNAGPIPVPVIDPPPTAQRNFHLSLTCLDGWRNSPVDRLKLLIVHLFFTSWVRMGAYDADFGGGGKASYAGLSRLPVADGLVIIAEPMYSKQDGLDVLLTLESKAMKAFSDQWHSLAL
ncbi:Chloramphenicol acetyltransferase-like domain [Phytophthora cactorum]|nr:Chloramphenicol acetyltransferase-like domain [Phytophthora cactorum]